MNPRTLVVPIAALTYALAVCAGCAASTGSSFGGFPDGTSGSGSYSSSRSTSSTALVTGSSASLSGDAAALVPNPIDGNPLCNASHNSGRCYPDDLTTAQACGIAPDGSTSFDLDAGYGDAGVGCHVVPSASPDAGPTPVCIAAGSGGDGEACTASSDCAPSFECVGAGVCRQYCCYAACDPTQFCDIQQETPGAGGLTVPVCMPIHPCELLGGDDGGTTCKATETCAVVSVVNGNALTSCVANGNARVGDSCDAEHCGAGLMCVGAAGSRRCYQLCHTTTADASSECPPTQTCTGGLPLFTDPMTGVCKAPIAADL